MKQKSSADTTTGTNRKTFPGNCLISTHGPAHACRTNENQTIQLPLTLVFFFFFKLEIDLCDIISLPVHVFPDKSKLEFEKIQKEKPCKASQTQCASIHAQQHFWTYETHTLKSNLINQSINN